MRTLLHLFLSPTICLLHALGARAATVDTKFLAMKPEPEFSRVLEGALATIIEFSKKNALGITSPNDFVEGITVHGSKEGFNSFVRANGWPAKKPIPRTYVGAGQNKKLEIVSQGVYKEIFPKDSPEDYQRLLTHELAHLAHVAYLKKEEDKMGPIWFFEGFACVVAGQYAAETLPKKEQLAGILSQAERGSYPIYAAIVRALAHEKTITELLNTAASAKFSPESEKLLKERAYK